MSTVHVIGAGMAGLGAVVALASSGQRVRLWEAANHAGGRCRSYFDAAVDARIDNGNHLVLSGNTAINRYLGEIGASDQLAGPESAKFHFFDLDSGERWVVWPNEGAIPWWLFNRSRRVPGASIIDHLQAIKLAWCTADATVAQVLGGNTAFDRLWEPLAVGVLNTQSSEAAATLLWPVVRETFGRGGRACKPRVAKHGLSETFVNPALAYLKTKGAEITLGSRLRGLVRGAGRVAALEFAGEAGTINLTAEDRVILAVPPGGAAALLPELTVPTDFRPILNAHFKLEPGEGAEHGIIGLTGGLSQWVFTRDGLASVTVSAAEAVIDESADVLAAKLWREVAKTLKLGARSMPAHRIVKEKRATIAQTPDQNAKRPSVVTPLENLTLAGDWTATGLPATIEGALRSGFNAAMHGTEPLERWTSF